MNDQEARLKEIYDLIERMPRCGHTELTLMWIPNTDHKSWNCSRCIANTMLEILYENNPENFEVD